MAEPESPDYDTSVIDVSPSGMNTKSKELQHLREQVMACLNTINTSQAELKLTWQGKAAQDQQDVTDRWARVTTDLFGTDDEPGKGVLSALADGVSSASGNFTKAENGIYEIFLAFKNQLASDDGEDQPPSDDPSPDELDKNNTFVTADYPPPI
jgi:uncharacterized protein YukE